MSEQQVPERTDDEARPEALADALGSGDELVDEIQQSLSSEAASAEQAVAPMELEELQASPTGAATLRDLDLLADVEVEVAVEFGRTAMPLRQLLQLRRGSLVELARRPEQQVTVLANGTPIAYGDVVVVGDQVGVHIVELVNPDQPPAIPPAPAQVEVVEPAAPVAETTESDPPAAAATDGDASPTEGAGPEAE